MFCLYKALYLSADLLKNCLWLELRAFLEKVYTLVKLLLIETYSLLLLFYLKKSLKREMHIK